MASGGSGVSEVADIGNRVNWILLLTFSLGLTALVSEASAGGPWRARVVDAESGQPLAGVVVLAYWIRSYPSVGGWADTEYYASEEVVTGADGRFRIGSRWSYTVPLIVKVAGPEWRIFKPGYGKWDYGDPENGEKFDRGEEITISMPPLKTREDRLAAMKPNLLPGVVPLEQMPRLLEAVNSERVGVGLQRIPQ